MVRIDADLLRRRAEHNEGELSTLEEVALNQFEIEKIETLDRLCKHLKIIYLSNNIIEKIENLNRLKELEYLNLALNNISKIENLQGCESLNKLDLTLNFIDIEDLEESVQNLKINQMLTTLFMTGNPCTDYERYREYVVAELPQLRELDGTEITHTERLQAQQNLIEILPDLRLRGQQNIQYKIDNPLTPEELAQRYSKESRIANAKETERQRIEKETDRKKQDDNYYGIKPREPASVYNKDGGIRQCNQGGYDFEIYEKHENGEQYIIIDLFIPRYMDTSLIDCDVQPQYVRINIKDRVTQLKLPCDIKIEQSKCLRSQTTGALQVIMPKVTPTLVPYYFIKDEKVKKKQEEQQKEPEESIPQRKFIPEPEDDYWEDDPDVPPLE